MDIQSIHYAESSSESEASMALPVTIENTLKDFKSDQSVSSCEYDSDSDDEPYIAPPHLVQITASKDECPILMLSSTSAEEYHVDKMISSFIAGRRARVNQQNIREFCGPDYDGQSCARVSAVHFKKRLVQVEDAEKYWARFMKK